MLNELLTKDCIQFIDHLPTWEDAIKASAQPLLSKGVIEPGYTDAIIDNVKTLGPYIVLGSEVAIPHARPEAGVNKLGMSFLKLKEPVYFSDDESHRVSLLFCLAAVDSSSHLEALSQLTKILCDKERLQELKDAQTADEVLAVLQGTPASVK
ncbi:MAG: PTS sugar transporter subunit IIA [Bacillus sp. (in: firmicutes)]